MFASNKDTEAAFSWSTKQAYIAHGFALAACAEMQIDSCGMEGFDPVAVGTILGLPPTQRAVVMLPIGYRAADETIRPKVRFPAEKLFTYVV
jgi:nitroreductase